MKTHKLTEQDLTRIIKKIIKENYPPYSQYTNKLEQIKSICEKLLSLDSDTTNIIIENNDDIIDYVDSIANDTKKLYGFMIRKAQTEKEYVDFEESHKS